MESKYRQKYDHVLDMLQDVSECAGGSLALAGGTALSLFYFKHRVSVDIDLIPLSGDEDSWKEKLKGCLSKKGYRTQRGRYSNQFMVQFEDTTIKVEIFMPSFKLGKTTPFPVGTSQLRVANLGDLMRMKIEAYKTRQAARDLFDVMVAEGEEAAQKLLNKFGPPKDIEDIAKMANSEEDAKRFLEMVSNASKASD